MTPEQEKESYPPNQTKSRQINLPPVGNSLIIGFSVVFLAIVYLIALGWNYFSIAYWLRPASDSSSSINSGKTWNLLSSRENPSQNGYFFCSQYFDDLDLEEIKESGIIQIRDGANASNLDDIRNEARAPGMSIGEASKFKDILTTLDHRASVHASIAKSSYSHSRASLVVASLSFLLATIFLFIRTREIELASHTNRDSGNGEGYPESASRNRFASIFLLVSIASFILFTNTPRVFLFDDNLTNHLKIYTDYIQLGREVCYSVITGRFVTEEQTADQATTSTIDVVEYSKYIYAVEKRMADLNKLSVLIDRRGVQGFKFGLDELTETRVPQLPESAEQ